MLRTIFVLPWLALLPLASGATVPAQVLAPVPVVQDARLEVATVKGKGILPIHVSRDWTQPQPGVTRAVIVIHGWLRRAVISGEMAATRAGALADDTMIITPQFLIQADLDAHHLPDATLRWGPDDWKSGYDARGPAPVSAFDVLDAILTRLADQHVFPGLRMVVIVGHSAGGQLVQRYAAVGHALESLQRREVHLRYVIANPSSYVYFTSDRPVDVNRRTDGTAASCPKANRWGYGFDGDLPSYVSQPVDLQVLERAYLARDVVYLLGTADNDPQHHQLDRSCAGQAQGASRFDRGTRYFSYLSSRPHNKGTQRLLEVPGIGHHSTRMFSSACGRAALFDQEGCTPDPTPRPATAQ